MTEQTAQWWYENEGQQAGPISAATLQGLIRSGQVRPTARVWRAGMAGWEQIAGVPELAAHVAVAPPPLAPQASPSAPAPQQPPYASPAPASPAPFDGAAPQPTFGAPVQNGHGVPQPAFGAGAAQPGYPASQPPYPQHAYARPQAPLVFEEISVGMLILLSVVSLGVYGMVKFYQTGKGYERLAGRESRFATYFWLYLGLSIGAFFVNIVAAPTGLLLTIAGVVFGVLTLLEALKVRDEGVRRYQLNVPITTEGTHKVLYILGVVLSFVAVGLVLLIIQAVKWFEDWNQIARGLGPRRF